MYDLVNGKFYGNKGNGAFTPGPSVHPYTITNRSSDPNKGSTTVNRTGSTAEIRDTVKAEAFANTGYYFVNWTCINLSSPVTDNPFIFTMPGNNVSLTANFAGNVTTVEYRNESDVTYDIKVYIFNESASLPVPVPEKARHTFNGWNITVGGNEYVFSNNETYIKDGKWVYQCANDTHLIVNASWTALPTYAIDNTSYVKNGTVIANETSAAAGETVHIDAFNTTLGYHFNEWNVTNSTGVKQTVTNGNFTMPSEMVYAGANFTANATTVTFHNDTSPESKLNLYGLATNMSVNPTKEGHTFARWNVSVGSGVWAAFDSPSYNNSGIWNYTGADKGTLDVYANWTVNTSIVSIDSVANGSVNAIPNSSVAYGTDVTLTNISEIGYHFVQYDIYKTGSSDIKVENSSNQFRMPDYAVNVSGVFAGNVTTVEFINGSTSAGTKLNTYHDVTNSTPGLAPYPGYAFMGWNVSNPSGTPFNSTGYNESGIWNYTGIDGETLKVYANWSRLFYTIRYHANNGTGAYVEKTDIPYDENVELNSTAKLGLSQAGLVFVNWTQYANGTGASYAEEEVVYNLAGTGTSTDLYAVWQTNQTALNSSKSEVSIGGKTYPQWNASADSPYVVGYDMFNGTAVFGPFVIESPGAANPLNYTLTKQNLSDSQTHGRINVTYRDGSGNFKELTWSSSEYSFEDHDGYGYINITETGRSKTGLSNVSVVVKEYPLGDANLNDQVDIIDSAVVGIYILKDNGEDVSANIFLPDEKKVHCDVNNDGEVNVADMLMINRYLVGSSDMVV